MPGPHQGTCSSHGPVWAHTSQALPSGAGVCVEVGIRPQTDRQTTNRQTVLSSAQGPGRACDWLQLFCLPTAGISVDTWVHVEHTPDLKRVV